MFLSFWVFQRQTQLTASLEPFAVTSAFKLAGNLPKAYCLIQNICETMSYCLFFSATSCMVLTLLKVPTRRLHFGLKKKNLCPGLQLKSPGFMKIKSID